MRRLATPCGASQHVHAWTRHLPFLYTLPIYPSYIPFLYTLPIYPSYIPFLCTLPIYPSYVPFPYTLPIYPSWYRYDSTSLQLDIRLCNAPATRYPSVPVSLQLDIRLCNAPATRYTPLQRRRSLTHARSNNGTCGGHTHSIPDPQRRGGIYEFAATIATIYELYILLLVCS